MLLDIKQVILEILFVANLLATTETRRYFITGTSGCIGLDGINGLSELLVNQPLLLVHISLQFLQHTTSISTTILSSYTSH